MLKGIDISNWEPTVILKDLDIDFAIFKATEGLSFKDPTLKGFCKQAQRAGMLFGCYHFARNNVPQHEAEFFYKVVKPYVGKCIFILDIEDTAIKNPAKYCKKFCDHFFKLSGVKPLIYTYDYYKTRFNGYASIYKDYDLWIAGYPHTYTTWTKDKCPYKATPWPYIAMWQFTDKGRLKSKNKRSSCPYNLDLNYAYMTKSAWQKYAAVVERQTPQT